MNALDRRCIEISYRHRLGHVSSNLDTVQLLAEIYRENSDPVLVLGNAHASIALYVVLESQGYCDAEEMFSRHGTHCKRDIGSDVFDCDAVDLMPHGFTGTIWVSGGSLGQPETIAVGLAMSDRNRTVQLVTSDGAAAEGAFWEALAFSGKERLHNLKVNIVANGHAAYQDVDIDYLAVRLAATFPARIYRPDNGWYPEWLRGIPGHYAVLNDVQYAELMDL